MSLARYHATVNDARAHASLWRLGEGLVCIALATIAWITGVFLLVSLSTGLPPDDVAEALLVTRNNPPRTVLFLFLYGGLGCGTYFAARMFQKRGLKSLVGPPPRTLRHFVIAMLCTWGVLGLVALVAVPLGGPFVANIDLTTWVKWLPLGVLVILAQTSSEEIFFRGYLQSQLAGSFGSTWVWLLLPALAFGAMHYQPTIPLIPALFFVVAATIFGLLAGDLTARTGSIGAAWGFHFANNSLAILFIANDRNFSGLGLFRSGTNLPPLQFFPSLAFVDVAGLIVVWALLRRLLPG